MRVKKKIAFPLVRDLLTFHAGTPPYFNNIHFSNASGFQMSVPSNPFALVPPTLNHIAWDDLSNNVGIRRIGLEKYVYGPNQIPRGDNTKPDVLRLVNISKQYEVTSPACPILMNMRIDIDFDSDNDSSVVFGFTSAHTYCSYVTVHPTNNNGIHIEVFRLLVDLWKVELATRPDGGQLWDYFMRAQTLPPQYQDMIRAACDRPITVILINLTDLYQDPISTMNIVAGEYFITNYTAQTPLSQNSILSISSLLGLLGTANPRDPRRMTPIISITKVRIQYAAPQPLPQGTKRPRSRSLEGGSAQRCIRRVPKKK